MYSRNIKPPDQKSFFLFGPRGTGKTTWLKTRFPKAVYVDLLESENFTKLLADPGRLEEYIPTDFKDWVILDEVQRVPMLLHEVHRLIESRRIKFIITGSSARKLRQREVNLLAGRALTYFFYPLTVQELGKDFRIGHALKYGHLPATFQEEDPQRYLKSYVSTYLREEVQQEGLTRNLSAFSRFLEAASFSQGALLNISEVARECSVHRKMVENYFSILEDLMIAERLPVFQRRAKRRIMFHPKFYFFDVGVYRTIHPKGPFDSSEEIEGMALETLVFQEIKAMNSYRQWGYDLSYWRTVTQLEVDFVLYGERGLQAIEVKRKENITEKDTRNLRAFLRDYPIAKAFLLYGGSRTLEQNGIRIVPVETFLRNIEEYL